MKLHIGWLISVLLSLLLSAAAQVTGSGTPGRIPIWTGSTTPSNTLGNSVIFQAGGKVGVRTNTPSATLTVVGPNAAADQGNASSALQVIGGSGGPSFFANPGNGAGIQLTSGAGGVCSA